MAWLIGYMAICFVTVINCLALALVTQHETDHDDEGDGDGPVVNAVILAPRRRLAAVPLTGLLPVTPRPPVAAAWLSEPRVCAGRYAPNHWPAAGIPAAAAT